MTDLVADLRANANEPWMTIGARPFAIEAANEITLLRETIKHLRHGIDRIDSLIHNLPRSATADEIDKLCIQLLNMSDVVK